MVRTAFLDVRVVPWRPRARVMSADTLRDAADPLTLADDLTGIVVGLALWLVIIIAAPVIVLLLAAVVLSIEVPVVLALALILLIARFSGLIPWQVVIIDPATDVEHRESHRSIRAASPGSAA